VRAVAIGAVAGRAGMLHLRLLDLVRLVGVAGDTQRFGIGLREHDFAVFGRGVADFALLVGERRMHELGHQLRRGRLVRVVTAHAIGLIKGLVLMRFLQVRAFGIVAIDAQRRRRFGEVEIEFDLAHFPGLVGGVAGVATHIEGGVAAAFLGNVKSGRVASQAKIFFLVSGSRL